MKKLFSSLVLGTALLTSTVAFAKAPKPAVNTSAKKHPNINAAQKLMVQAANKITAAQKANEFDLGGHAAKAKDLLDQASAEMKLAAETSNENAKDGK